MAAAPALLIVISGPSGVGKTETALTLADLMYGGERNLITINMSEFQEAHTVSTLKGSPPGYVGYGEGGVDFLTTWREVDNIVTNPPFSLKR